MEDLKKRILKIISNCNKPKVRTIQCIEIGIVLHLDTISQYLKTQTGIWDISLSVLQYRILLQGCWYQLFGGNPDDCPTELENRREEELSQPLLGEESLMIRHSSSYQSMGSDGSPAHKPALLPLFLPGRIIQITEDGPSRRYVYAEFAQQQINQKYETVFMCAP